MVVVTDCFVEKTELKQVEVEVVVVINCFVERTELKQAEV